MNMQVCPLQELSLKLISHTGAVPMGRRKQTAPSVNSVQTCEEYGTVALEEIEKIISNSDHVAVSALKIYHSVYRSVAGMWGFLMPS